MTDADPWTPSIPWGDESGIAALFDLIRRPAWQAQAACRGMGPELFFPPLGATGGTHPNPAREICAGCPVRVECGTFAVENVEMYGTWGGMSPRRRQKIRTENPKPRVTPGPWNLPAACGTDAGYYRHLRGTHTPPCDPCKAAHSRVTTVRQAKPEHVSHRVEREGRRRAERIAAGWCRPCTNSQHSMCRAEGCKCPKCGQVSVQLPADHAVKGALACPVPDVVAGVEALRGPAGRDFDGEVA